MRICSKFVQLHDSKCPVERELQLQNSLKTWKTDTIEPRVQYLFCQNSVVKNGTRLKTHIEQFACHVLSSSTKIYGRFLHDNE